jgi:hypothetical protein
MSISVVCLTIDSNAKPFETQITPTTRALDGAEAAVGFEFDGSGWCAAEGHGLKSEVRRMKDEG